MAKQKEKHRVIDRWRIGETLRRGRYSWIKRGEDIKTGKIVALTFIEKQGLSSLKEQAKQVETELEALRNICHPNVMKVYAYNLNAQYPMIADGDNINDEKTYINTILLVQEYVPGGELFDILYYTSAVKENIARTFFKQIINGLEAYHNGNMIHRDLKPEHLLLDPNYTLKIANFDVSKIIQSDADIIMQTKNTTYHPYTAPELLLNQKYDAKCDIFSAGVILFLLLAGYPPFERATKNDKWFKPLIKGNIEKFWKAHHKSPIQHIPEVKDLLTKMLSVDPQKRIDINGIKSHQWFKGETLTPNELIAELRDRHRKADKKRRQDVRKMTDLAVSLNPSRSICMFERLVLKPFPDEYMEGMFGEAYTYLDVAQIWNDRNGLWDLFDVAIWEKHGQCNFDFNTDKLNCEMSISRNTSIDSEDMIKFSIEIFESRLWKDRYKEVDESDLIVEKNEHQVFVVKITRTVGDAWIFRKIKNEFILSYCSSIVKGLPNWAWKLEKTQDLAVRELSRCKCLIVGFMKENVGNNDLFDENIMGVCFRYYFDLWKIYDYDDDDEYYKEIGDIFVDQNKGGITFDSKSISNK